jgi:hypothetical protein
MLMSRLRVVSGSCCRSSQIINSSSCPPVVALQSEGGQEWKEARWAMEDEFRRLLTPTSLAHRTAELPHPSAFNSSSPALSLFLSTYKAPRRCFVAFLSLLILTSPFDWLLTFSAYNSTTSHPDLTSTRCHLPPPFHAPIVAFRLPCRRITLPNHASRRPRQFPLAPRASPRLDHWTGKHPRQCDKTPERYLVRQPTRRLR